MSDDTLLVPDGTLGELLIQGPIVGEGYHQDPEKTSASFIEGLDWLADGAATGIASTVYRTGDLAYFQPDGTLMFLGRRDNQVKVNEPRLPLHGSFSEMLMLREIKTKVQLLMKNRSMDNELSLAKSRPKFSRQSICSATSRW
jgi:acyl-CoA synthetase (AMP-forming)/AMP-acid ligase II